MDKAEHDVLIQWLSPSTTVLGLQVATPRVRIAIARTDLCTNGIVEGPIGSRIDQHSTMDRPAVTRHCDALVEHLIFDRARKHEPIAPLRRVIEASVSVSRCNQRLPVCRERHGAIEH